MLCSKYHALGNDYIVVKPNQTKILQTAIIQRICHPHYGLGSDGILYGPLPSENCDFALRIYNPDGSEAEKSGNGLRIFSRYLYDGGLVDIAPFTIETAGGKVTARVERSDLIHIEMGKIQVDEAETLTINHRSFTIHPANIGNPHCVIPQDEISAAETQKWGRLIEENGRFPQRTNVQFMKIIDRAAIQIEIWERGAGYTLASGSSSCAAAAVAHKLEHCDRDVTVQMQGGNIHIYINPDNTVHMSGSVTKIADAFLSEEMFLEIGRPNGSPLRANQL